METNFSNSKNQKFKNVSLSIAIFKYTFEILLLINLFIALIELRKFYKRKNNNKVHSIETGRIVKINLLP